MTFDDIEEVIGSRLPPRASTHRAWFSNNPTSNPMTRAWLAAGYKSADVDMAGRKLVFRKMVSEQPAAELRDIAAAIPTVAELRDIAAAIPTAAELRDIAAAMPTAAELRDIAGAMPTAAELRDIAGMPERQVSLQELESELDGCIRDVENGATVIVNRNGRRVARIIPETESAEQKRAALKASGAFDWSGRRPKSRRPSAHLRDGGSLSDSIINERR
jgi:antitoxin (DNA-binding transcriptional repressor) of toxin-antitoxin stability system